jgi:hypothetical protein
MDWQGITQLTKQENSHGDGIMSQVLKTDGSGWIPGVADHRVDLLLSAGIAVIAGGA